MSVEFTDNTAKIKAALSEGVIGFLHEAGGEIQAQTQRNSRVDTEQTKGLTNIWLMKEKMNQLLL